MSSIIKCFRSFRFFFLLALTVSATIAFASEHEGHGEHAKKSFNAGEVIMDHITDSYDWHIAGEGHDAISIPLPVILYSSENGLEVFLSSKFEHGHKAHNGYRILTRDYMAEHGIDKNKYLPGKIVCVNDDGSINDDKTAGLYDISITKNVVALFFSVALILWIFISVAKAYNRRGLAAPKGMQSFFEPVILFIRDDVAKPNIGKKHERFMPYLLTVFFFIWINNMLGLVPIIPGGANLTGNISVTLTLALITFLITLFVSNKHYWRHIVAMPGVPWPILIILTPIEILGMFIRPFVLMMRLFANITAGHIVVLTFISLIFIFGEKGTGAGVGVSPFSIVFVVCLSLLELLVAVLQAYVFTLLSAIYIGAAMDEGHHDDHH